MKVLLFFFRYAPRLLISSVLVGLIGGASSAALLAVINDHLAAAAVPSVRTGLLFAGLMALAMAASYASRLLVIHLSNQTSFDLRLGLSRQALASRLRDLESMGSHQILATLTQDINHLTTALVSLPPLCINLSIVVGCALYLGWLSQPLLVILIVYLVLAVLSVKIPEHFAADILRQARERWDALFQQFRALTGGLKELKLLDRRRRAFLSGPLETTASEYREMSTRSSRIYALSNSWGQVLYFVFIGVILFGVPLYKPMDISVLTGYTLAVLFMRASIVGLLDAVPVFARARVALDKVQALGVGLASFEPGPPLDPASPTIERLDLSGITHRYYREKEERHFTLGPIDLTLRAGELVFLAGGNGSGKTTLAKLVVGLYEPEAGTIVLDGEEITDQNRDHYRQHFSAMFSDFFLFESLLGLESPEGEALDAQAAYYLERLELDHKVEVRDGQLSTTDLSQGQRRRLALLTAYLEDNAIFVFDEWAADQDPAFKRVFYLELLPELRDRGKAVLIITHDDSYFHVADRLYKLTDGRLEQPASIDPPQLSPVGTGSERELVHQNRGER